LPRLLDYGKIRSDIGDCGVMGLTDAEYDLAIAYCNKSIKRWMEENPDKTNAEMYGFEIPGPEKTDEMSCRLREKVGYPMNPEGRCYWCNQESVLTHVARLHAIAGGVAFEATCSRCAEKQSAAAWIQHYKIDTEPDFKEALQSTKGLDR